MRKLLLVAAILASVACSVDEQTDEERCGPFPTSPGQYHIEFRTDGTVVVPNATWNILIGRMADLERYAFCLRQQ